jgi:predicted DNA-binding transcriptional regulator YafY
MYHPTTRVLTVLELLQSHPRLSGPELARRLEVDRRTVRRYVCMLQELGIPVEGGRGRYGSYRLRPGFKLPPLLFSEDEALALVLGLLAARRMGLAATAPAVEGALAKVERVLPAALRDRVRAVQEILVLDRVGLEGVPAANEVVVTISAAARQRQRVWLRHVSFDGRESERELDPYSIVYRAGRWYAAGYCHLRHELRVFRLDRVLAVEPREASFERPADFDALAEVERAIASVPQEWYAEVLLYTTLADTRCRVPPAFAIMEETSDGVLLRCQVNHLSYVASVVAGLGCTFTVREPPELRDELRALAARVLAGAELPAAVSP